MKTKLLTAVIAVFILSKGFGQFAFGVSPGLNLNKAYFGYKLNRFVPFAGIQFLRTSGSYEYNYKEFDYSLNQVVDRKNTSEYMASIIMPNLGLKWFFKESGTLKAHTTINFVKPLINARYIYNGDVDEDLKDFIQGLSMWGGEMSFGMEYFFDDHFSVGGEFGLRLFHTKLETNYESQVYNDNTGLYENYTRNYQMKYNFSPTFSKISLNFYF